MAQNKLFRFGPTLLTNNTLTNLLNPPTLTGGTPSAAAPYINTYISLAQIHVASKSGSANTFSLYLGATGANAQGTELASAISVPANSEYNLYFAKGLRMDAADFLVGGASAVNTLIISGYGEIGIAG